MAISPTGSGRIRAPRPEILDALTLWVLGRNRRGFAPCRPALADAESAAHAPTIGHALAFAAFLALFRCKPEAVATYSQAYADIVSRYDLPAYCAGIAVFFQAWVKCSDCAESSELAEMRRGLAIDREQGWIWFLPGFEAALAEAEASAGKTDAGLRRLDNALAELGTTENRWYEAEMHRIRAEILLKRDPADTAAAEQSLQTAIAIAQSQKARSFEFRAALSLAKLYRGGQSRRRCARRAGAGGRGLPADPTIPRTCRGASPSLGAKTLDRLPPISQSCPRRRSPIGGRAGHTRYLLRPLLGLCYLGPTHSDRVGRMRRRLMRFADLPTVRSIADKLTRRAPITR